MKKFLFVIIVPLILMFQNSCGDKKQDNLESAEKLIKEGKYEHAISEYYRILSDVYYGLGTAEFKRRNYEGAIKAFDALLMIDPTNDDAYLMRGDAKYVLRSVSEACLDWGKASELGNDEAKHHSEKHCRKK